MRTHTMWIAAAIALAIVACDDSTTEAPLAPSPTVGTPAPVAGTETAPVPPNTLRHDAERYLDQKASQLISIRDRRRNLYQWMERFGHIRTLALDQHIGELNAQLYEWRKNLSGATCNHRRDALMNVVRVLYGSRAASGLSDLVTFPKAPPKPRALDRSHIADVIRKVEPESKLRARLELMQWTRMRPSQMGRLTPEDFQLDAEIPHVIVAQGKGGKAAAVPLLEEGVAAARAFIAIGAFENGGRNRRTENWPGRPSRPGGRRSRRTRSGTASRPDCAKAAPTSPTSRTCTGT